VNCHHCYVTSDLFFLLRMQDELPVYCLLHFMFLFAIIRCWKKDFFFIVRCSMISYCEEVDSVTSHSEINVFISLSEIPVFISLDNLGIL
jgi:hypothetical protein